MSSSKKQPAGTPPPAKSVKSAALTGVVRAPGDKSISHRSIIFGAMAEGTTEVTGLLTGDDILSTVGAMRGLGAEITEQDGTWFVKGVGKSGLQSPKTDIDCGNAGTGVRLIMGAAAGYPLSATFTGDASLSSRPMNRILNPLREMGVSAKARTTDKGEEGRLPVTLKSNGALIPIEYTPPHASAQVKSAILLAGINTKGTTTVVEPTLTRDHTENMLRAFGAVVETKSRKDATHISVTGPTPLKAAKINVPGDPSSAAFLIVAALITPGSSIIIENVMMNPTRTGLFEALTAMGAYLRADNFRKSGGETIADIEVKHSKLVGINVPENRAASMIDEYPILAVAAAFASGTTIMNGIGELRVKESDRIAATAALLSANGVKVAEREDGLTVTGNGGGLVKGGGIVKTHHDHRIAMSALILGLGAENPVTIDDASMIATSFPSFFALMHTLGAIIDYTPPADAL
ncbi:3-phosphoshikimate 1-carboxyvinyltransferase [Litorimonas taeanensis]|uniref:3-phosphoshikimate 1-carboxyvinyltransferase n=1 Tax=Litorimonas taeanensis TaxID=568099 RepID=A0A420WF73_9PROT|nr:3-phosphoshikimate 1-carboxyvinyltransferase [Litorimonas taeanensis]RKQ69636.1 3-phosphoshikimate 1-carboxyvinyltransferase [Litorimonas taeanensis]